MIKPIDAQVLYQSTPKVAELQHNESSKAHNAQLQNAVAMQEKIEVDKERVKNLTEVEKARINKKEEKEKQNDKHQNDEHQKKKKNNQETTGNNIDIRI